ncbi:spore coat U domain-containing protein [Mesorhizobium sp. M0664]|uniref:Csu type fimbrial protein n=1 Tax=Mesorhizobium sp. M0664 TaxID=2956982 RepID=UPI00333DBD7E
MTNSAFAATAAGNMTVRLTITNECKVQTGGDLNFGSHGVIDANLDQTTLIGVQCTSGQTYNVGLGVGKGSGATLAVRKMTSPAAATINYTIYRDSARTLVWGETVGTDTVTGTGDGNVQNITAYGRVPAQLTPAAGDYTDTVAITVTY